MRQKNKSVSLKVLAVGLLAGCLLFFGVSGALAEQSSSANYRVDEAGFLTGSQPESSSSSYQSRIGVGDLVVGHSESGNFIGYGGFISPEDEYIELVIPAATVDLGKLEPGVPSVGSASFSARTYLSHYYSIISPRLGPTSNGYTFQNITTAAPVDTNIEQFGINLVANTSPSTIGANPTQQPVNDGTFAFGQAAPGYNTANNYQYNPGDVIAQSGARGYGETDYTISYVINAATTTPAGQYVMEQDLVLTATF